MVRSRPSGSDASKRIRRVSSSTPVAGGAQPTVGGGTTSSVTVIGTAHVSAKPDASRTMKRGSCTPIWPSVGVHEKTADATLKLEPVGRSAAESVSGARPPSSTIEKVRVRVAITAWEPGQ